MATQIKNEGATMKNIYEAKLDMGNLKAFLSGHSTGKTTKTARILKTRGLSTMHMALAALTGMRAYRTRYQAKIAANPSFLTKEIRARLAKLPSQVRGAISSIVDDTAKEQGRTKSPQTEIVLRKVEMSTWGEGPDGTPEEFEAIGAPRGEVWGGGEPPDDWEDAWDDIEGEELRSPSLPKATESTAEIADKPVDRIERERDTPAKTWGPVPTAPSPMSKADRCEFPPPHAIRAKEKADMADDRRNRSIHNHMKTAPTFYSHREESAPSHADRQFRKRSTAYGKLKNERPSLRKTRMCFHTLDGKECPRGADCNFAHSIDELNLIECVFGVACNKGSKCTYWHKENESRYSFISKHYPQMCIQCS